MTRRKVVLIGSIVLGLSVMAVIWLTEIPLGIPGEWTWDRITYDADAVYDLALNAVLCSVFAAGYVLWVRRGSDRVSKASDALVWGWLIGLVALGFGWLSLVQLSQPATYGLSKSPWVLYYPMASGYFHDARFRDESLTEYLRNYEKDIQTEDQSRRVLHHGTHPPGLFVCYRGLIAVCNRAPGLVRLANATQPPSVEAMFEDIKTRQALVGRNVTETDRAAIWLAVLFTQLAGAAVVVPLYFVARQWTGPNSAWWAASFWPTVPALAVFLPKSDVLYAFLGTAFLALWIAGIQKQSWWRLFFSGIVLWAGMFLSLALLPVVFLAGIWWLSECFSSERDANSESPRRRLIGPAVCGMGFLIPTFWVWLQFDLSLGMVWILNYRNHAEFYAHFQRSYGPWLAVNPLETMFAVGAPLFLLAASGIGALPKFRSARNVIGAMAFTLLLLWVSGKNRGEAARLWLVIFPWFAWLSVWGIETIPEDSAPLPRKGWVTFLLVAQILFAWMTAARVSGFPL